MSNEIRGIDLTLAVKNPMSPSQYVEVDVFSELGVQLTNSSEEKTTKGSDQKRELSTKSALKSYSMDGNFVTDLTALDVLTDAAESTDPKIDARVSVGSKTYTGTWLIANITHRGGSQGVVTGTISLESAGAIVVA
jgi:hypothetical protein